MLFCFFSGVQMVLCTVPGVWSSNNYLMNSLSAVIELWWSILMEFRHRIVDFQWLSASYKIWARLAIELHWHRQIFGNAVIFPRSIQWFVQWINTRSRHSSETYNFVMTINARLRKTSALAPYKWLRARATCVVQQRPLTPQNVFQFIRVNAKIRLFYIKCYSLKWLLLRWKRRWLVGH